ncbi:hypothetical protein MYAM1_000760 [Malassezia yamatoensis]|uniref:Dopey N-terminal domain-containing protein n=1 Tax=Malassezia yamatoensis TaxID=253288 RepID=A0AAJ6CFS1_9BASI|nr:hypothetical protein MYAM1_000760 [Malassezia yamatoensis]
MPGWNPDALVSRQVATNATVQDVGEAADEWRSAAAKYEQKRWAEHSEIALQSDPNFKRHQANVERALAKFENVSEWADFISFLSRLLKALQAAPKFNAIPHKLIVAKRLSQCLNPALPSGVHARALEVYNHILSVIGVDGLRRDLPVWTPGLLPFFQNAATSVKPVLLDIFERYYIQLSVDLRPVTRALLLSLLPGLEEESSESFDRVVSILNQIAASVGRPFFLQNIWLVIITSSTTRISALNYLSHHMPKLHGTKCDADISVDTTATTSFDQGNEEGIPLTELRPNLLVHGFVHTLGDDSLLVRRNALDFLVMNLPLASQAFMEIRRSDRVLLIDAAIGAVLRKDISLNRRLYAWLLGAGETDEQQQAYFDQYALAYVSDALRNSMTKRTDDTSIQQKPYRIMVSMMDKGVIGQLLQKSIILDALHSLVHDTHLNAASDLYPTAQMLFESINPYMLYQQLFFAIEKELDEPNGRARYGSAIQLFEEILITFGHHDEEALSIHLPALYFVLLDWIKDKVIAKVISPTKVLEIFSLLRNIQAILPARIYVQLSSSTMKPLGYAATYLYVDNGPQDSLATVQDQGQFAIMLKTLFQLGLDTVPSIPWNAEYRHRVSSGCFHLILVNIQRLDAARDLPVTDDAASQPEALSSELFDAEAWNDKAVEYLVQSLDFDLFATLLNVIIKTNQSKSITANFRCGYQDIQRILLALLRYMQPGQFQHHQQAVDLFYALRTLSSDDYVSSILNSQVLEGDTQKHTLAAFGTLWRISEQQGRIQGLLNCILLILDGVHSEDILKQRTSKMWLQTYVANYASLLNLVLDRVFEIATDCAPKSIKTADHSVQINEYTVPFDQDVQNYYLQTLITILTQGGPKLVQSMKTTMRGDSSVLDELSSHLILLLRSLPARSEGFSAGNEASHTLCLEIIELILDSGSADLVWCADLQHHLTDALLVALDRREAITQVALLATVYRVAHKRWHKLDADARIALVELVRQALGRVPDITAFNACTDFASKLLDLGKEQTSVVTLPLCMHVGEILASALQQMTSSEGDIAWRNAFLPTRIGTPLRVPDSDFEVDRMIRVVEHALMYALAMRDSNGTERQSEIESNATVGFLGNISSVFSSDATPNPGTSSPPKIPVASQVLQILIYVWVSSRGPESSRILLPTILEQVTKSLDRIYHRHSSAVMEATLENWWNRTIGDSDCPAAHYVHQHTISLLVYLTGSPQVLVSSLSDAVFSRIALNSDNKKTGSKNFLSEMVIIQFLSLYLDQLSKESIVEVWPLLSLFSKNISNAHAANKALIFQTLRIMSIAGNKLASSHAYEERRTRRDFQDTYVRLCEQTISLYARTLDVSAARRNAKDSDAASGMDIPQDAQKPAGQAATIAPHPSQIVSFFSSSVLTSLEHLATDSDKTLAICTSLVYYVITPGFKGRQRPVDIDQQVLDMLSVLCNVPGTVKTWRGIVTDVFMDSRFFLLPPTVGKQWTTMAAALYGKERDRLVDIIGRISNTPTNNLFTSRETDLMYRAVSIRRLTFAIYSGSRDQFLAQLPLIQEKVVDILRSNAPELVQVEIYLCMRVLLCRFASQHLAGFWPVILTELLRLFGKARAELPRDQTDAMHLLFSTSKLADYLLTLQTEDFQIHQWLLISDTPDAIDPPREWIPDSLLDCIGRMAAEHTGQVTMDPFQIKPGSLRKPILQISRADDIASLKPFFLFVSKTTYNDQVESSGIDWANINEDLLKDLFEPIVI